MDFYLTSRLVLLFVLILVSMFFSAVETSLLSFPRTRLRQKADEPGLVGRAFKEWQDHPNRLLTTILIGNNTANIAVTTQAAYMAVHFAEANHWNRVLTGSLVSGVVVVVLIVFGEAIPKVMARSHAISAAPFLILFLHLFDKAMAPLNWILGHSVALLFPGLGKSSVSLVTEDDIKHFVEMGQESGAIQEEEKKMIQSIFEFSDTTVNKVMIPRTDMFCVDIATPFEKLLDLVVQNGYSRVPVYKGTADKIVGIIHTRDLLSIWKNRELIVVQDLFRKPYFVPETMRVDRLLREFRRGRLHMAIVVDEYGGTAGLVTMEDLVEEIVGEIRDEHETGDERAIARQPDGSWVIEADVALSDVNEALGLHLAPKGEVASLGGYLMELAGKVPKKARVIEDKEAGFKILDASETSVLKVKVVKRRTPLLLSPAVEAPVKPRKKRIKSPSAEAAPAGTPAPEMPSVETPLEATDAKTEKSS